MQVELKRSELATRFTSTEAWLASFEVAMLQLYLPTQFYRLNDVFPSVNPAGLPSGFFGFGPNTTLHLAP